MNKIALVIVTYNATPWIEACLTSLQKQMRRDFDVYVVDNNSQDKTCQIIEEKFPETILIRSKENTGFARGNNIALKKALAAGSDYFILLNQDTIVEANFIEEGMKVIERPEVGISSPKILYLSNKKIWWAGSKVYRRVDLLLRPQFQIATHVSKKEDDTGQFDKECETDYIPGTSLFTKREVLEKAGLLDESFFMYSEDLDFSLRVREAGYKLVYTPKTIVYHDTPFKSQGKKPLKSVLKKYNNYFFGVKKIVDRYFSFW
ncbi:glycosyltransferase family 2 protein, partial [Patescibacteria group bacterium]|nr:glycosyltransferase family 2 protein [Patescibacteria group bacterium]